MSSLIGGAGNSIAPAVADPLRLRLKKSSLATATSAASPVAVTRLNGEEGRGEKFNAEGSAKQAAALQSTFSTSLSPERACGKARLPSIAAAAFLASDTSASFADDGTTNSPPLFLK